MATFTADIPWIFVAALSMSSISFVASDMDEGLHFQFPAMKGVLSTAVVVVVVVVVVSVVDVCRCQQISN